jgi:hypothetical protein
VADASSAWPLRLFGADSVVKLRPPSASERTWLWVRLGNVAASRGSSPGRDAKRGLAALLLLAAVAPATAVAQRTPQPVFTELFAYAELAAYCRSQVTAAGTSKGRAEASPAPMP